MNPKIIAYIDKARKEGKTDDRIREELKSIGVEESAINDGLIVSSKSIVDATDLSSPDPVKPGKDVKSPPESEKAKLEKTFNTSVNLFFYLAGLSLLNNLLFYANAGVYFPICLSITLLIDGFLSLFGTNGMYSAFFFDLFIVSIYFSIGLLAKKRNKLVHIVGIIFYVIDGLLAFVIFLSAHTMDYGMILIVHLVITGYLINGLLVSRKLDKYESTKDEEGPSNADIKKLVIIIACVLLFTAGLAGAFFVWAAWDFGSRVGGITDNAVRDMNPDICQQIQDEKNIMMCCAFVGYNVSEVNICDKATYPHCSAVCIAAVADNSGDASLCDKITDMQDRNECIYHVESSIKQKNVVDKPLNPSLVETTLNDVVVATTQPKNEDVSEPLNAVVIAVGGYGSSASATDGVCSYFKARGLDCVGVDSSMDNRVEPDVIADLKAKIGQLSPKYDKVILWGGSNGALTSLIAASEDNRVYAVLATSPPLFYDFDSQKYNIFNKFNVNLVYVFGEPDYTDEKTAKILVSRAKLYGKNAEYTIIKGAGHEICCGDQRALDIHYKALKGFISGENQ
ncbi:MAG: hypothetical protein KKD39_05605 [Candidatus Altiarchaeota archaeon]|nr:hypothetical protein [Candidatus Altiarchaeota archaeon]